MLRSPAVYEREENISLRTLYVPYHFAGLFSFYL